METSPRFALLEHDARQASDPGAQATGLHWDLLIDVGVGERVATWRLSANPLIAPDPVDAVRIGEHRRAYFDFEGQVGGGRGTVRRLDRGAIGVVSRSPDCIVVELAGRALRGRWRLSCVGGGRWRLEPEPPAL
jgi:hypothetical protein